jgi:serine/threonine protein kinase
VTYPITDIIHGDIKPQNILIFKDGPDGYVARVADFGFSTWFRGDNDFILMPRSRPWYAPEYHGRGFSPDDAKRMDVYSFGMLCLWLLLGPFLGFKDVPELELLELWKRENKLSEQATRLVVEHGYFNNDVTDKLCQFFDSTLAHESDKRTIDFELILPLLTPTQ